MGYFGLRRYGLYICATQEQADDHVGTNVAGLFEVIGAQRLVGKYGHSRGWRRNRVWTADGFAVDALGLDTAARGAKLDDTRPDFMIIDDIDQDHDTELLVMKKMRSLTRKLLPAGSGDLAVLGVQNLVHEHGIFSRLVDGRADFLTNRVVSGPYPALNHLTYAGEGKDAVLTSGEPTWEGLSLLRCQGMVQLMGLEAFLAECQHEKRTLASTMFGDVWQAQVHVLEPFPIPAPWRIDRTFDWGSSRPFAVLWWAEADGVTRTDDGRAFPRGTVFCINELYGWNGVPNQGLRLTNTQIAERILEREAATNYRARIRPGRADTQIFDVINGRSIADEMAAKGVRGSLRIRGLGAGAKAGSGCAICCGRQHCLHLKAPHCMCSVRARNGSALSPPYVVIMWIRMM